MSTYMIRMTRRLLILLLLVPGLAWGQTRSAQQVLADLPVTHREYSIYDYGALCNGSTDDGPAIQLAANAAATAGGGVVTGWGTCAMATAVSITASQVTFSAKHFGDGNHDVGSNDNGWTLKWTGSSGATMLTFTAVAGASNQVLYGAGAQGVTFDCNNSAGIGLKLISVRGGSWESLYFVECTTAGLDTIPIGNSGTLGEAGDVQGNRFLGIHTRIILSSGIGIRLRGSPNGSANTSFDTFYTSALEYKNGDGIQVQDADNVGFYDVQMVRAASGTGIGIELTGDSAASARSLFLYDLSPGAGGVTIRGTETNPNAVQNIQLIGYDVTNSPPTPVIGTGVTGVTIYKESGHAAGFGMVGGGGGATDPPGAVFAGKETDLQTAFTRLPNTTYSQYIYNSSSDGVWFDDGTGKWQFRLDASHNFNLTRQAGTGQIFLNAQVTTNLGFINGGSTFTVGTGTGGCATSSTLTGGATGGSLVCTGTAGASTIVINLPSAAHAWVCIGGDLTSGVAWTQIAASNATTSCKLTGTLTTTSDVVDFTAQGY